MPYKRSMRQRPPQTHTGGKRPTQMRSAREDLRFTAPAVATPLTVLIQSVHFWDRQQQNSEFQVMASSIWCDQADPELRSTIFYRALRRTTGRIPTSLKAPRTHPTTIYNTAVSRGSRP